MAYIGKKPEDAFRGLAYYDTFTGDGSTTTFDLSADAPDGGQNDITVVVDNVRQEPGATKSYTLGDDGSGNYRRITFNVAPDNGSEIYAINPGRSTQLNTVSDNAISAAKIQTDAVTTAKIQDDAVTSAKIADGTIVSSNIAPGTIANDRLANTGITINGTSIALGASGEIVAGTDWQAVTVADGSTTVNTVAGGGYLLDTNAGVIEVFLPTSPTRGDTVVIADYSGTFATNRVIVNTGGANIDSTATGDVQLTTNNTIAEFIYIDSAKGWLVKTNQAAGTTPSSALTGFSSSYDIVNPFVSATGGTITTSGDYKIHTFTGDGCFVVTSAGFATACQPSIVDYLVVAGGAGGGGSEANGDSGGGGGAGGFRESKASASPTHTASPHTASPLAATAGITVTATTYPITVGAGGTGGLQPGQGGNGSNSVFSTITSAGGGGGGTFPTPYAGLSGGSGGGGAGGNPNTPGSANGGSGNTPPTSPPQGNPGGAASDGPLNVWGGGGGGATQAGTSACAYGTLGDGGDGGQTSINGSATYYAGGGGGGATPARPTVGGAPGGLGGGGSGVTGSCNPGTANTGGGGGGGDNDDGGAGGKGIVIIRYKFQ